MMKINQNLTFHLVSISAWPMIISFSLFNNLISMIMWFHKMNYLIFLSIPCSLMCSYQWWRDVIRESTFQGSHTFLVFKGFCMGMILFIISQVFFFLYFFWAYFHSSLAPMEIDQLWPPLGIKSFNPFDIPLMNTIILLSSGMMITWSHHSMLNTNFSESFKSLMLTIILGLYSLFSKSLNILNLLFLSQIQFVDLFFLLQLAFTVYIITVITVYIITVVIGTLFISVCLLRMNFLHFSSMHRFGFKAAAWYWHFVDIIWFEHLNCIWKLYFMFNM